MPNSPRFFLRELESFYNATSPDVLLLYGVDSDLEFILRAGYPWKIILIDPFGNAMHKTAEARAEREAFETKVPVRRVRK